MRGQQHHPVGRLQPRPDQVDKVAGRGVGDRRPRRLVLVEQRQRPAARPAAQDHLAIAEPGLQVGDAGPRSSTHFSRIRAVSLPR